MRPVAHLADHDDAIAFPAFHALVDPALRAAARTPLRRARHANRDCRAPVGPGWCADCETSVGDLLMAGFTRLREVLNGSVPVTRTGEPVREWAVLRAHLTSPEAEHENTAELATVLCRPAADDEAPWLRAARAQLVHHPLQHLEERTRRQDAVARGAAARPERDLRQARWAAPLRTDPILLDLLIVAVFRTRRGLTDLLHVPDDVRERHGLTPAQATEAMRRALTALHTVNPAFFAANLGDTAVSLLRPDPSEIRPHHADPFVPLTTIMERARARATLHRLIAPSHRRHPDHRPVIAAICAVDAGENTDPVKVARHTLGLAPNPPTASSAAWSPWSQQRTSPGPNSSSPRPPAPHPPLVRAPAATRHRAIRPRHERPGPRSRHPPGPAPRADRLHSPSTPTRGDVPSHHGGGEPDAQPVSPRGTATRQRRNPGQPAVRTCIRTAEPRGKTSGVRPLPMGFQQTPRPGRTTGGSLQNGATSASLRLLRPGALLWGPHPPYEGSQHLLEALPGGTSGTGPHPPYEGSQHHAAFQRARLLPRPHPPYEGSQRRQWDVGEEASGGSSSALRGIATVLASMNSTDLDRRPHPPYEGSQHVPVVFLNRLRTVLIRPTRDRNALSRSGWWARWPSPHPPYEGSQHHAGVAGAAGPEVLIRPTRDCNNGLQPHQSPPSRWSSSALRGIATGRFLPMLLMKFTSPHPPYKGSQPGDDEAGLAQLHVLIRPTRGRSIVVGTGCSRWSDCPHRLRGGR